MIRALVAEDWVVEFFRACCVEKQKNQKITLVEGNWWEMVAIDGKLAILIVGELH